MYRTCACISALHICLYYWITVPDKTLITDGVDTDAVAVDGHGGGGDANNTAADASTDDS
jgi:hypothetical protein